MPKNIKIKQLTDGRFVIIADGKYHRSPEGNVYAYRKWIDAYDDSKRLRPRIYQPIAR